MKPICSTKLLELQCWCRKYHRRTKYPANAIERFLIGMYQIPGYFEWDNSHNKWESLASAFLHLLMVAEEYGCEVEIFLNRDLCALITRPLDTLRLLENLCKVSQQLTYGNPRNKTARAKRRFKHGALTNRLANALEGLMMAIPSAQRESAIANATTIMTEAL